MQHDVGAPSALGSRVGSSLSNHSSVISTRSKRHRGRGRMNYANLYSHAIESEEMYDLGHPTHSNSNGERNYASGLYAKNFDEMSATHTHDDIRPEDAADAVRNDEKNTQIRIFQDYLLINHFFLPVLCVE